MKRLMLISGAVVMAIAFAPGWASATMDMQKQAKAAGVKDVTCASCHAVKMPKKGASDLNDKGKWLVSQKTQKKADKIDGAWLKDYQEGAK